MWRCWAKHHHHLYFLFSCRLGTGRELSLFVLTSQTLEVRKQWRLVLDKILSDITTQKPKHIRHYRSLKQSLETRKFQLFTRSRASLWSLASIVCLSVGTVGRGWEKMIYYSRVFSLSLHLMLTIICSYHSI